MKLVAWFFLLITALCLAKHVFTYTPSAPVTIGGNLSGNNYYYPNAFIDCTKLSYFGTNNPFDSNGWPIGVYFSHFFQVSRRGSLAIGVYTIQIEGKVTISAYATSFTDAHDGGQLLSQTFDSSTNLTTAYFDLYSNSTSMHVTYTKPVNGTFKNFKVLKPGYTASDAINQVFTNEFLNDIKALSTIRFMDWGSTNFNPTFKWSERPLPTDATWSYSTSAIPYEIMIKLVNIAKKDAYINIPAKADDDYILQLAKLVYSQLDADRNVYLEYSNEMWNYGFSQAAYNYQQAFAYVNASLPKLTPLNYDNETSSYYWAYRRSIYRTSQICETFGSVFGKNQIGKRVRCVINCQAGNPGLFVPIFRYFFSYFGSLPNIYALAIAPYISLPNNNVTLTNDDAIDLLRTYTEASSTNYLKYLALARFYGLKVMAYEGGYGYDNSKTTFNAEILYNASFDTRFTAILIRYFSTWFSYGFSTFNYFNICRGCVGYDSYSKVFGGNIYGWIRDQQDTQSARKAGVEAMVAQGSVPLNTTLFRSVPDYLDSSQKSLTVSLAKNIWNPQTISFVPSYAFYTANTTISYPIIVTTRGLYNISVETKANNPYMYFNVYLDNNWAGRYMASVSKVVFNSTTITYNKIIEEGFLLFSVIPETLRSMDLGNFTITLTSAIPVSESSSTITPTTSPSITPTTSAITPKTSNTATNSSTTAVTSRNVISKGDRLGASSMVIVAVFCIMLLHNFQY